MINWRATTKTEGYLPFSQRDNLIAFFHDYDPSSPDDNQPHGDLQRYQLPQDPRRLTNLTTPYHCLFQLTTTEFYYFSSSLPNPGAMHMTSPITTLSSRNPRGKEECCADLDMAALSVLSLTMVVRVDSGA